MYDVILKNDLLNIKKCSNIYDLQSNREYMKKVIVCRTHDKLNLINYMLANCIIDDELYYELLQRTRIDYQKANLYLLGLCQI